MKKYQLTEALDWIGRDTMPVKVNKCIKVVPFIRVSEDDKRFVPMLLNTSFDSTGMFEVEIRVSSIGKVVEMQMDRTM